MNASHKPCAWKDFGVTEQMLYASLACSTSRVSLPDPHHLTLNNVKSMPPWLIWLLIMWGHAECRHCLVNHASNASNASVCVAPHCHHIRIRCHLQSFYFCSFVSVRDICKTTLLWHIYSLVLGIYLSLFINSKIGLFWSPWFIVVWNKFARSMWIILAANVIVFHSYESAVLWSTFGVNMYDSACKSSLKPSYLSCWLLLSKKWSYHGLIMRKWWRFLSRY